MSSASAGEDARSSSLRFAVDFPPHDDHYRLLSQAWISPTDSGTIDVGGAMVR